MAEKIELKETKAVKETAYTKLAYLKDKSYNADLINALLEDNKTYTKAEVKKIINDFLGKKE